MSSEMDEWTYAWQAIEVTIKGRKVWRPELTAFDPECARYINENITMAMRKNGGVNRGFGR